MCQAAAELYGGCLEGWGADWAAAGYADEQAFLGSCATWAWELRLLEVEAGAEGATDEACRERDLALRAGLLAEPPTCAAFTDIDWSLPPWP